MDKVHCYMFDVSAQDLTSTEEPSFLKIALIVSFKLYQLVQGTSVLQLYNGLFFFFYLNLLFWSL